MGNAAAERARAREIAGVSGAARRRLEKLNKFFKNLLTNKISNAVSKSPSSKQKHTHSHYDLCNAKLNPRMAYTHTHTKPIKD